MRYSLFPTLLCLFFVALPACYVVVVSTKILALLRPTFALTEARLDCLPPDPFYREFFHKAPSQGYSRIPKIIHNLWKDENIPTKWNQTVFSCHHVVHPDWEFKLWTDESARKFIQDEYPKFLPQYDRYKYPIQRVDAARYFIIYHYGGVYLDLDIGCRIPLTIITEQGWAGVMGATKPSGVSNDMLMFEPRHPFMKEVIDGLEEADQWYGVGYLTVMASAGPVYLSNKFALWLQENTDDTEHPIILLPNHLYSNTLKSFFFHLQGDTWHGADAITLLFVIHHIKLFIGMLILILGLGIVYSIRCRRNGWRRRRSNERKREDV